MWALQSPTRWTETAVHDTVAAIVSQAEYQRSLSQSLWLRIGNWIQQLLRRLFELFAGSGNARYILYAIFVAVVLLIVGRIVIGYRDARKSVEVRSGRTRRSAGLDHLRHAEQLAGEGDFTAAAHALCAALLDACASRGEVRLHASKTTGDYAREMRRRQSQSARGFQQFREQYDPVVYRDVTVNEQGYRALADTAIPLIRRERAA